MTRINSLKVGVSGVRGIVGDSFTPSLVADFAAAFGEYVGKGRVIIGRDTRPTGEMIENAVVAGLLSVGCQPVLIGIVPTPTVQIMVDEYHANGGIAISASHNPEEWNAMKFVGPSGVFLNYTEAAELLDIYNQPDTTFAAEQDYRNMRSIENAFDFHKQRIWDHIDKDAIRKAGFKVAIDCCNGAGAFFSRGFLEELGCEVVSIFDEKDGIFRRKPEPVPENIHELGRCVRENACDIGFAQDPDADRIVAVDSKGQPIGEQYSIVLAAEHVLSKTPGNVVVNVQTTKALEDLARKRGCEVFYSRVGEINVTDMMAAKQAVIGGEGGSGGVIWPLVHPCRDSFTGMALILEMMALRSASIEDILNSIPRYFTSNVKVKCSAEAALDLIRTLRKEYADLRLTTVDGLRIDWEDAWILIRPSNTEPVLRISSEALSQGKADNLTEEFAAKVKAYLA